MPSATEECRSCRAPVYWCEKFPVEMQDKGPHAGMPKTMPVDAGTIGDPTGNIEVWSEPVIPVIGGQAAYVFRFRYLKKNEQPSQGHSRAISHFATCPEAGKWRRS